MNWKIIFFLSLFGLAMAFATVYPLSGKIEPVSWLVIFLVSAYIIAKKANGQYFLHGFLVALGNCVWITIVHLLLFRFYFLHHPHMVEMMRGMPLTNHPRLMMVITSPIIGVISGCVLGLFAFFAAKMVKKAA